jgi:hypothetical protein
MEELLATLRGKIELTCERTELFMPAEQTTLEVIESRESTIEALRGYLDECNMIENFLKERLCQIDAIYNSEYDAVYQFVRKRQPKQLRHFEDETTPLRSDFDESKTTGYGCQSDMKMVLHQMYPRTGDVRRVAITPKLSLVAKIINSPDDADGADGLCYVPRMQHFAINIAGHTFHGNIGRIFTQNVYEKIKDCRYVGTCTKGALCEYYHNPTLFHGSTDCRNFLAHSWLYGDRRARTFGSRDRLDIDIVTVTNDEVARLQDQIMHDILCFLVFKEFTQR